MSPGLTMTFLLTPRFYGLIRIVAPVAGRPSFEGRPAGRRNR